MHPGDAPKKVAVAFRLHLHHRSDFSSRGSTCNASLPLTATCAFVLIHLLLPPKYLDHYLGFAVQAPGKRIKHIEYKKHQSHGVERNIHHFFTKLRSAPFLHGVGTLTADLRTADELRQRALGELTGSDQKREEIGSQLSRCGDQTRFEASARGVLDLEVPDCSGLGRNQPGDPEVKVIRLDLNPFFHLRWASESISSVNTLSRNVGPPVNRSRCYSNLETCLVDVFRSPNHL